VTQYMVTEPPNPSLQPTRYARGTHGVVGLVVISVSVAPSTCDRARLMLLPLGGTIQCRYKGERV
jgi:hypothetical protein